jgi:hypothetical protein
MFVLESGDVPVGGAPHNSAYTVQEREHCGGLFVFAPCHVKFDLDLRLTQPDGHKVDTRKTMIGGRANSQQNCLARRDHQRASFFILDMGDRKMCPQALLAVQTEYFVVKPTGETTVENDRRFSGNVFRSQKSAFGQAVRRRKDDHKLLFEQQFTIQMGMVDGRTEKPNVNFSVSQRLVLQAGAEVLALHVQGREVFAVLRYDRAEHTSQTGRNANLDAAAFSFVSVASRFHRMSGLRHKLSCFFEKNAAFLRQGHAPFIAQKESNTKVLFQLSDLAAEGRLRDVELLRRFAEVKALCNRYKISNMTEFHGQPFYTLWVCFRTSFPLYEP